MEKKEIIQNYIKSLDSGKSCAEWCTKECKVLSPVFGELPIKEYEVTHAKAAKNMKHKLLHFFHSDDPNFYAVHIQKTFQTTSDKNVTYEGVYLFEFSGDKISKHTLIYDPTKVAEALGKKPVAAEV